MLVKEIQIKNKKELDRMFDNAQKIEKEIVKNYEEFDEEIASMLGIIIGTYQTFKEFHFLEDAKIFKKYILEDHRPNFNALIRTLIKNLEEELIIDYMEED